jgi:NADH dehydrogenase
VTGIDLRARVVRYAVGGLRQPRELSFDYLLLALGSETNYFGMDDVEAGAVTMKTLGDAALLRNRTVALLEEAAQETDDARRRRLMTFVVAGGGFAGVETVGAINDFLRDTLKYYPELDPRMLRVVLVHPGTVVLAELGERLGCYAQEKLRRRGVEVRSETRVTGYEDEAVCVSPGEPIGAMTLIWTAGVKPAPALGPLEVEKVDGRVRVNEFLEVPGYQGIVWAWATARRCPTEAAGFIRRRRSTPSARESSPRRTSRRRSTGGRTQAFPVHHDRAVGVDRSSDRRGTDPRDPILGLRRLVAVAERVPEQAAGISKKARVAIKWSLDLLFPREIEQLVTLRDVEQIERIGGMLRAMRGAAECGSAPRAGAPVRELIAS